MDLVIDDFDLDAARQERYLEELSWYLQAQWFKCYYCLRNIYYSADSTDQNRATLDHIVPRSEGGEREAGNVVACCRRCNKAKANMGYPEFMAIIDAPTLSTIVRSSRPTVWSAFRLNWVSNQTHINNIWVTRRKLKHEGKLRLMPSAEELAHQRRQYLALMERKGRHASGTYAEAGDTSFGVG